MGNLKTSLFLAYKSIIKGNRWALVLIILVMSLSFINLMLVSSILSGLTDTLDEQQVNNLYANIIIDPKENEYYLDQSGQIENMISRVPGVVGVSSHLTSNARIEYLWKEKDSPSDKGKSGNWHITGIEPGKEASVTTIHEHILEGSYLDANDRDEIILGIEIAGGETALTSEHLTLGGAKVGEKVRLTYPNGVQKEYRIKGIFQSKEMTSADRQAFVSRKEMSSILGQSAFRDRATQILVKVDDTNSEKWYIESFKSLGINGQIRSWREYGGISSIISSFDIIASLINGIGLIVAAIVMFIVIYINVLSKKRQIGILRAIGIKRNIVITSYIFQALFFAVAGVIFGGIVFGFVIEPYFLQHPLDLPIGTVSLTVENSTVQKAVWGLLFAGVCAGFIPVLSIIRQSIIRSIWGN